MVTKDEHRTHSLDMLPIALSDDSSRSKAPEVDCPQTTTASPATLSAQLTALYRAHSRFVWRSLRRLGVSDRSIDDALQDVFLVAYRKLAQFEGRSSHRVWLFAIATRVASDHRKRDRRMHLDESAVAAACAVGASSLEVRRRVHLLERLLQPLNELQRATFVMAEIEGLSAPEIAETLDVNLNTVYSRLRLARARFARALAQHTLEQRSRSWSLLSQR